MQLPEFLRKKPTLMIALFVVLIGSAVFLILPIVVGAPGGTAYPIASGDHISSWSWHGVYLDGGENEANTKAEITKLKGGVGKGTSDYDIFVGIASQYELLGDGKSAYQYLSAAISKDPKRGLAYMNLGHLLEELGAFDTAHQAYDAAVKAEPTNPLYQAALQNFLVHHSVKP